MRYLLSNLCATLLLFLASCSDGQSTAVDATLPQMQPKDAGDASREQQVGADAGRCSERLECVAPPLGCHYVGGDGCTSCGGMVCTDAGAVELDAGRDASSTGPDGSLSCGSGGFDSLDRVCTSQTECIVVEHQINCCGTRRAIAIRTDQMSVFQAAETSCRAGYPACGCAEQAVQADDGTTATPGQPVRAACVDGRCTSTFTAISTGLSCTPAAGSCGLGYSCCSTCGAAPGCPPSCRPSCSPSGPGCVNGCIPAP